MRITNNDKTVFKWFVFGAFCGMIINIYDHIKEKRKGIIICEAI